MDAAIALPGELFIVRHQDQGRALLTLQGEHQFGDVRAGSPIQISGRFIREQQGGIAGKGPRQRDPLLFATGKLSGKVRHALAQTDPFQPFLCPRPGLRVSGQFQRQAHVFQRGQCRQKLKRLKHEADTAMGSVTGA